MTQPLRVFISSKMQELKQERATIKDSLQSEQVQGWLFEADAGAQTTPVVETYEGELAEADIYVGVFWKGYGVHTREEYTLARTLEKPCLIYVKRTRAGEAREPRGIQPHRCRRSI